MGLNAIGSHGTLISRQPNGAGGFTTIGELKDITPPAKQRNAFETTAQQDNDDFHIKGIRRKGELTFSVNFAVAGEVTHGLVSGLMQSWNAGQTDGWRVTYPDATSETYLGFITNIQPTDPVEGVQTADLTIRPTGAITFA